MNSFSNATKQERIQLDRHTENHIVLHKILKRHHELHGYHSPARSGFAAF